jgi:aminoglycoside phosphotransferase (APT) family kinase protein
MTDIDPHIALIAAKLAEQHLSGTLKSVEPITNKGEVNQVFILSTEVHKAVLRLNDLAELARFQKEQWCAQAAMAQSVPGAKVMVVDSDDTYAFMLLEFVDGRNGSAIPHSGELWSTLGQLLRQIHSIPVGGFGEKLDDILHGTRKQWEGYIRYNIESLTADDALIKRGILDVSQSRALRVLFEGLLSIDFSFGLNHGDFSLANVIVDGDSLPHIIDWGSAQAHVVPHHDLGVILDESLDADSAEFLSLLSGYEMIRADYEKIKEEIGWLQLLEAADQVRWALEKAPQRLDHCVGQLKKFLPALTTATQSG